MSSQGVPPRVLPQAFRPAALALYKSNWIEFKRWLRNPRPTDLLGHQQISGWGICPSERQSWALWSVCNWSVYREDQSTTCLLVFHPVGLEVTLRFHSWVTPSLCGPLICSLILCPLFWFSMSCFLCCHKMCFAFLFPPSVFLCLFHNPPSEFLSVYCSLCLSLSGCN